MKRTTFIFLILIIAVGGGYFAWQFGKSGQDSILSSEQIPPIDTAPDSEPSNVRYPVPEPSPSAPPPPEKPASGSVVEPGPSQFEEDSAPPGPDELHIAVPDLNKSDGALRSILARFFPRQKLGELFRLDNFVKRIVVTVDMLPHKKVPPRLLPYQPAPGSLAVEGQGEIRYITAQNSWRYRSFVKLVDAVDTQKAVDWYVHFYPLFQEAYQNLGYPDRYFNDRLVDVIDHLLQAPEVDEPIAVKQHVVQYRFADPELEALSAGQKLMIRIGNENSRLIKSKLRAFRKQLTSLNQSRETSTP